MRSLPKLFVLHLEILLLAFVGVFASPRILLAQSSPENQTGGRVVLVLPFDNRSGDTTLNWIGDSFPDTLNKRLSSAGFLTISRDDRAFAFDHLGLPTGFRPSRATTIRIAQQLDANFVVIGSYNVNAQASPGSRGRAHLHPGQGPLDRRAPPLAAGRGQRRIDSPL
jgi:TolB-like protein